MQIANMPWGDSMHEDEIVDLLDIFVRHISNRGNDFVTVIVLKMMNWKKRYYVPYEKKRKKF